MLTTTLAMTNVLRKKSISPVSLVKKDLLPAPRCVMPETAAEFWEKIGSGIREMKAGHYITWEEFTESLKQNLCIKQWFYLEQEMNLNSASPIFFLI